MKYVWREGAWRDDEGRPMEIPHRDGPCVPMIQSDIAPYRSVVSNKLIEGRAAQREDLKRSGCRLVDPSEFKVEKAQTKKWAERLKVDWAPEKPAEHMPTTIGPA